MNGCGSRTFMSKLETATAAADERFAIEPESTTFPKGNTFSHSVMKVSVLAREPNFPLTSLISTHSDAITAPRRSDRESRFRKCIQQTKLSQSFGDRNRPRSNTTFTRGTRFHSLF